jgi:hypothetical protein
VLLGLLLSRGFQSALNLADTAAATTYNKPSVAALDPLVTQGQNANLAAAATNQPGTMATNFVNAYQPLLANGGVSALGLEGVGNLNQAAKYLDPYASGSYVQSGNPYLDAAIAKNDAATMARINSNFSSAGRYGSPAQAGTAAGAISAADNATRMAQYNQDKADQLAAIQVWGISVLPRLASDSGGWKYQFLRQCLANSRTRAALGW